MVGIALRRSPQQGDDVGASMTFISSTTSSMPIVIQTGAESLGSTGLSKEIVALLAAVGAVVVTLLVGTIIFYQVKSTGRCRRSGRSSRGAKSKYVRSTFIAAIPSMSLSSTLAPLKGSSGWERGTLGKEYGSQKPVLPPIVVDPKVDWNLHVMTNQEVPKATGKQQVDGNGVKAPTQPLEPQTCPPSDAKISSGTTLVASHLVMDDEKSKRDKKARRVLFRSSFHVVNHAEDNPSRCSSQQTVVQPHGIRQESGLQCPADVVTKDDRKRAEKVVPKMKFPTVSRAGLLPKSSAIKGRKRRPDTAEWKYSRSFMSLENNNGSEVAPSMSTFPILPYAPFKGTPPSREGSNAQAATVKGEPSLEEKQRQRQESPNPPKLRSLPRQMIVATSFTPQLEDEMMVKVGEVVKLSEEFFDGWCLVERRRGINVERGVMPKVCLRERE
ncbi:hypothetical protein AX17_003924 [Amanita inopinata Kibby_2008]|nr:hypothetical protein AX17_003924 [Amanita inopinata Kibby_2008]